MSDDGSQTDDLTQAKTPDPAKAPDAANDRRSTDGIERLLDEAEAELAAADAPHGTQPQPFQLNELKGEDGSDAPLSIDVLSNVDLDLRIELGRTHMRLEDVLQLRSGSVVALDRLAGDPVDVFVNDRLVAKGEVLVLNESFCVRVTELVTGGKN